MKIQSDNPQLLDEIYNDLGRKNIESEKVQKKIDGAMGDVTVYIALAAFGMQTIDVFINYLTYRLSQKNNYIHFKYKDGIEVKFDNLSKEELKKKELQIRQDIADNKLEFIYIG